MTKRILITGANGFIGRHLLQRIESQNEKFLVSAFPREKLDLLNTKDLTRIIEEVKPDFLFHLAGQTASSDENLLFQKNIAATENLLKILLARAPHCKTVIPGSAAEYGNQTLSTPITEDAPTNPTTPYGISKLEQTKLALSYAQKGLHVSVGRIFNILAPDAPKNSVIGTVLEQIHTINRSPQKSGNIFTGPLNSSRDFLDISDIVDALVTIALLGNSYEIYNIASGQATEIRKIVTEFVKMSHLDIQIIEKLESSQSSTTFFSCGNNQKITKHAAWSPKISLHDSVQNCISTVLNSDNI